MLKQLIFGVLWVCLIVPSWAGAVAPPASGEVARGMAARLERDAADIRELFAKAATAGFDEASLRQEVDRLRLVLSAQRREARVTGGDGAAVVLEKLERLGIRLDDFERFLALDPQRRHGAASPFAPRRASEPGPTLAPSNDACESAIPISLGQTAGGTSVGATRDGNASCGAAFVSPDVWYSYTATGFNGVSFDLIGSGYDTVLSLHHACPGVVDNELSCNDDAVGLDSATSAYVSLGETVLIRVSGVDGATGPFVLHAGLGGSVSGNVTAEGSGDPLTSGFLRALTADLYGYYYVDYPDANGHYSVAGLPAGSYLLRTQSFEGFLDELHADVPCPSDSCSQVGATPVALSSVGAVQVDFALGVGSGVSGTLTDAGTGDPLVDGMVTVYDDQGEPIESMEADADGHYVVSGLSAGTYHASALAVGYRSEAYDDLLCPYSWCVLEATPIVVGASQTVTGIDFALDRFGAIGGTVTDASTSLPIPDAVVWIDGDGGSDAVATDAEGHYLTSGLAPGDYRVQADRWPYQAQVYDGIGCSSSSCFATPGTPVSVALNSTPASVDFVLVPLGGIAGTVTEESSGAPLEGVWVAAMRPGSSFPSEYGVTGPEGSYSVEGLYPGDWRLTTTSDHADEIYDDVPCPYGPAAEGSCDVDAATPVAVALAATSAGVDFSLGPSGGISGTVTDSSTGDPIDFLVEVFDQDGSYVTGSYSSGGGSGAYDIQDLAPGAYFVMASWYAHIPQLFAGVECAGSCDPTAGTPVVVTAGTTTPQIDFALRPYGALIVHVIDVTTLLPIYSYVQMLDANGVELGYDYGSDASIEVPAAGKVYVRVFGDDYLTGLYDGVICGPDCDPTKGTPLFVAPALVREITVALVPSGAAGIGGKVSTTDKRRLAGVTVNLWNASGQWLASTETLVSGQYFFPDLAAGQYRVATSNALGFFDQVWDDATCPATGCDPTTGSLITLGESGPTVQAPGIDFRLPSKPILEDGFESGDLSGWSAAVP